MRITSRQLRQIIREELDFLSKNRAQLSPEQEDIVMQARDLGNQTFANALADMMRTSNESHALKIAEKLFLSGISGQMYQLYLTAANASNSGIGGRIMTRKTHDEYGHEWGSHPYHYPPGQESSAYRGAYKYR